MAFLLILTVEARQQLYAAQIKCLSDMHLNAALLAMLRNMGRSFEHFNFSCTTTKQNNFINWHTEIRVEPEDGGLAMDVG